MQRIIFLNGIFYDAKKHGSLTEGGNKFLILTQSVIRSFSENWDKKESGNFQDFLENSRLFSAPALSVAELGSMFNLLLQDLMTSTPCQSDVSGI